MDSSQKKELASAFLWALFAAAVTVSVSFIGGVIYFLFCIFK